MVLNNEGYGTMRKIRDGTFNVISRWNYGKICELVGGGHATVATTKGQLDGALRTALGSNDVYVIDVHLPRDGMSPQLTNMTTEMGAGAAIRRSEWGKQILGRLGLNSLRRVETVRKSLTMKHAFSPGIKADKRLCYKG